MACSDSAAYRKTELNRVQGNTPLFGEARLALIALVLFALAAAGCVNSDRLSRLRARNHETDTARLARRAPVRLAEPLTLEAAIQIGRNNENGD